jgi:hypothetical protein
MQRPMGRTMPRHSAVFVFLSALLPLAAQSPRVSTAVLPARAAFALAVVEDIARLRDAAVAAGRGPAVDRDLVGRLGLGGYTTLFVHAAGDDGAVTIARSSGIDVPYGLDAQRWALYAFPAENDAPPARTFFLAADGPVLCSDGSAGHDAAQPPAATAAFGKGGGGTWRARQRSAGAGEDGGLWQLASTLPRARCTLDVRTADGLPAAGIELLLTPEHGLPATRELPRGVPLPGRWPAGITAAGADGTARLHGVAATGLVVRASVGGTLVTLGTDAVRADGDTLRVTLSRELQDQKRLRANESAAIATLRNIGSAQSQCQASGVVDADGDGAGEFGFFAELAGAAAVRSDAAGGVGETRISPPVLSTAFARVRGARVQRSGYRFQLFLPAADGTWTAEHADGGGGRGVRVDPDRAERAFVCVAWPAAAGWTGQRAFAIDQGGVVHAHGNDDGAFSGDTGVTPPAGALPPGFVPADQPRPAGR